MIHSASSFPLEQFTFSFLYIELSLNLISTSLHTPSLKTPVYVFYKSRVSVSKSTTFLVHRPILTRFLRNCVCIEVENMNLALRLV